ncbi:MAG TPA: DUF5667 domain-containing protein [Anaerolineales bacterium]|nr:DUF5667 domain-containing protein [Anaerolineales bacterium]
MKLHEIRLDKQTGDLLAPLREAPARDRAAAAAGKATFLHQAKTLKISAAVQPQASRPSQERRPALPLLARLAAVVLAVVFLAGTASTVYAAQSSLPDETLYPLKTFSEDVHLALTVSPQAQLNLTLEFTDRRVDEITALQAAGKAIPQNLIDRYQDELDRTLSLAVRLGDPAMTQSLGQVSEHAAGQLQKLHELEGNNPSLQALQNVHDRLQQQVRDAELGKTDPQGFRLLIQGTDKGKHENPDGNPTNPDSTQVPSGNGNGPGGYQPAGTPTPDHGGPNNGQPTKTPRGHGHGPGFPDKTHEPGQGQNDRP